MIEKRTIPDIIAMKSDSEITLLISNITNTKIMSNRQANITLTSISQPFMYHSDYSMDLEPWIHSTL